MINDLWNLGVKVEDLDKEVDFMLAAGAELVLREWLPFAGEKFEYAILMLGGIRILLFPIVVFEEQIGREVAPGLTHAVFETEDIEAEVERLKGIGAEVLIGPTFVEGGFGSRRVAFFRSPAGVVFEAIQILEDKLSSE